MEFQKKKKKPLGELTCKSNKNVTKTSKDNLKRAVFGVPWSKDKIFCPSGKYILIIGVRLNRKPNKLFLS